MKPYKGKEWLHLQQDGVNDFTNGEEEVTQKSEKSSKKKRYLQQLGNKQLKCEESIHAQIKKRWHFQQD
jgi:hypothetical protein